MQVCAAILLACNNDGVAIFDYQVDGVFFNFYTHTENASLLQEEIKRQPAMIDRYYGKKEEVEKINM